MRRKLQIAALVIAVGMTMLISFSVVGQKPKNNRKEELTRWYSQGFRIGKPADFRSDDRNPSVQMSFTCNASYCDCSSLTDCADMAITDVCGGDFIACTHRGGRVRCICNRT